ncbi:Carboxypeptidase regulatory-like domain protein [uncultured archaeon]|nr:Carboxypeptidase regulatory-like domain protein [uncultured archaeon]
MAYRGGYSAAVLTLLILIALTGAASAQGYNLTGHVLDTNSTAIQGATVSWAGGNTLTAIDGSYTLTGITNGSHAVMAGKSGFDPDSVSITISGADSSQDFTLASGWAGISLSLGQATALFYSFVTSFAAFAQAAFWVGIVLVVCMIIGFALNTLNPDRWH